MRISGRVWSRLVLLLGLIFLASTVLLADSDIYNFGLVGIDGTPKPLAFYKGEVMLIVNVASQCGYTPQYAGLEALYEKYKDQGLVVLGFPANNFGEQEPGTNAEIKTFCSRKYNVTFPMYSKISVKAPDQSPLYRYLVKEDPSHSGDIKWNFTKFLVDRDGKIVQRFEPAVKPDDPQVVVDARRQVDGRLVERLVLCRHLARRRERLGDHGRRAGAVERHGALLDVGREQHRADLTASGAGDPGQR